MLRPILEKMGPAVREQGEQLLVQIHREAAGQQARLEELLASTQNGDPQAGHALFNSAKTACATCHAIGYLGGQVGPDLSRIGAVRSVRDLLESIVYPSATFVRSYEPMIVTTRDGEEHSGIVHHETAESIRLVSGPNAEVHLRSADIVDIRPGALSLMPEGLDQQLSPIELANLVAFLRSLR
jgi:putative heme-binding domain-containing protein